jgi:hypothetical protein
MIFGSPYNCVATSVMLILLNTLFLLLLLYKYDIVYTRTCYGDHGCCKDGESYLLIPITYLLGTYYPLPICLLGTSTTPYIGTYVHT